MSLKSMAIVTAAALVTIAGGASAASAHGHHGHHSFKHRHHHGLRIILGGGYSGCSHLYRRWQYTGSHYWKRRYLACKYGW